MSDDLVITALVLVLLKEICSTRKCNLVNVLINLVLCHSDTVIGYFYSLFLRVDFNGHFSLIIIWKLIVSHHPELFELRDSVAGVTYELSVKNIVVRIQPFLYHRKNIFTRDRKTSAFFCHKKITPLNIC